MAVVLLAFAPPAFTAEAPRTTYVIAPDSNRMTAMTGSDPATFIHNVNGDIDAWTQAGQSQTVVYDAMNTAPRGDSEISCV